MKRLAFLLLGAGAAPALAQSMPGMTAPASATTPIDPACPPKHAAMGHCTPAPSAPADPACPPEHAAMGHCTPAPSAPIDPAATGTALPAGNAAPPPPPA
ncbi:MAG: copper resistance protein B, partial [Sphingomonas sp.]